MPLLLSVAALQLVLPWCAALALPRFLSGKTLEDDVLLGLVPVVASVAALMLLTSVPLYTTKQRSSVLLRIAHGVVALGIGAVIFHVAICLFGAPFAVLIPQTFLLALLLSSLSFLPAAVCLGLRFHDWVAVLVNFRVRNQEELLLASSVVGATLGVYLGALPIPLDWDRPWQQWPLTCVYGALGGHALGIVAGFAVTAWKWWTPATSHQVKRE